MEENSEGTPLLLPSINRRRESNTWSRRGLQLIPIAIGQGLSILICLSAVTSVYLTNSYNLHMPTFQNFVFYLFLSLIFTSTLACRPGEDNLLPVLKSRGWKYFLLALADAEANFLVVKAYQYTTLTSVQLLDCFTIPTVLLLSRFLLRVQYKFLHILGVLICLTGVGCLVWADIKDGNSSGDATQRLIGDVLCLSGAFLYGVSNVAQEFLVKSFDVVEFLGMVGLFGTIITGTQAAILEYDQVTEGVLTSGSSVPIYLILGYAFVQLGFYLLAALFMKISSATLYNLSILTADFYSLLAGIFLFQYSLHALYFVSFVLVISGVVVFSLKPTTTIRLQQSSSSIESAYGGTTTAVATRQNDSEGRGGASLI